MHTCKRTITALLITAMLLASCGTESETETTAETAATIVTETETETEESYDYTGIDFGGKDYRILSTIDYYSMHMQFDRDELTGEGLNDAIYNRNRQVEQKMNLVINENAVATEPAWQSGGQLVQQIKQAVEGGEDVCDLAFIPPGGASSMVLKGYFNNLTPIEGFHWEERWYNQQYNESATLYGKRYFGMSDATIGLMDGMWAMYFNEDMMADYNLDLPYDLVREGKWTIDKMQEYLVAVASLNGDESFTWNSSGNAVYGLSFIVNGQYRLMHSFGEKFVENVNEELTFTAGSDRFYRAVDKLYTICSPDAGLSINGSAGDWDTDSGGNIYIFADERALFLGQELGKTAQFRELEFTFGLVPFPMLDEEQGKYYTTTYADAVAFSIPITTADPAYSAAVLDALAFEGMKQVVPIYREITLEQKGLRNEASVEMLGIIADGAFCNVAAMFGLHTLDEIVARELVAHKGNMSSSVASQQKSLTTRIEKLKTDFTK